MKYNNQAYWNKKTVDLVKRETKASLDAITTTSGKRDYLKQIIHSLHDDFQGDRPLRLLIAIISRLVLASRERERLQPEHHKLAEYGRKILQVHGITPASSRVAFLHGEIDLVMSQLTKQSGRQWESAWLQQRAFHMSGASADDLSGTNALGMAIRAMRLGHSQIALAQFEYAEKALTNVQDFFRARLGRIQALRLVQNYDHADELSRDLKKNHDLPKIVEQEVIWEASLRKVQTDQDLTAITTLVNKKSPFFQSSYLLEYHFWARAIASKKWLERPIATHLLQRQKSLNVAAEGFFLKACRQLEACHDSAYPFVSRVDGLGAILANAHQVISIDRELLLWAAAGRWLMRNHAFGLASLVIAEYSSQSLRVSQGKTRDALGISSDMFDKEWFTGNPQT